MRLGAVLSFAALSVSCATAPPPSLSEPPLPPGETVVVQPGQTAWEIAAEAGLSVEEIVEVNGLRSADEVAAGQILFLPAGALPPKPRPSSEPSAPSSEPPPAATLAWPVDGVVLRDFAPPQAAGQRTKPGYEGILIAAPAGTPVRAAAAGVVAFAGSQGTATGLFVVVDHGGGLVGVYAHLARIAVTQGQTVAQGDVLGEIGTSGLQGVSPRVQFQLRRDRVPIDPLPLLPP